MSDLKISVKDFRAIHSADIDLNGITVIAGVNGSGKSTLSKLLYTIFDKVKTLDDVYWNVFYSEILSIEEVCQQIFDTLKPTDFNYLFGTTVEEMRGNIQKAISLLADSISQEEKIKRLQSIIKYNLGIEIKSKEDLNLIMEAFEKAVARYEERKKNRPFKELGNEIASDFMDDNIVDKVSVSEYGYTFFGLGVESVPLLHSVKFCTYIDTPKKLEIPYSYSEWDYINSQKDATYNQEISKYLSDNILKGETSYSEQWKGLVYQRKDGQTFHLSESATGVQAFAFLQLLLKKGLINDRSLIIIDEPEAHLHPQWIVEYAKVLVELNKKTKARFFIATHSTDMVSALRYISEKEETLDHLSFYRAVPSDADAYTYDYQDMGTDIEPIFESFNKSYELIEKYGTDNG
ncbi:MAG: AAA family ATPase [Prevotella sp.]|nr:AAA family ATPase [Prevotella sp.]